MRAWNVASLCLITAVTVLGLAGPATGEGDAAGRLVATVGREAITSDDVVAFFYDRHREGWVRTMEDLLDERIVAHESKRMGMTVPPDVLRRALDDEVEARAKQLRDAYGEHAELAVVLKEAYGLDLDGWKRTVLAPRLRMQLLLQRVVRLDTRRRDRVKVRVIVVPTEARAKKVMQKLREGADFSLIALKESIDPTAKTGGDLPSIARGDLTLPDVEAKLFQVAPGALVGPLPVTLRGEAQWHVYKVIERTPSWGNDRSLLQRVEKDLAENPLGRAEFERWRGRMRRDFRVRVFDPQGHPVALPSSGR